MLGWELRWPPPIACRPTTIAGRLRISARDLIPRSLLSHFRAAVSKQASPRPSYEVGTLGGPQPLRGIRPACQRTTASRLYSGAPVRLLPAIVDLSAGWS